MENIPKWRQAAYWFKSLDAVLGYPIPKSDLYMYRTVHSEFFVQKPSDFPLGSVSGKTFAFNLG